MEEMTANELAIRGAHTALGAVIGGWTGRIAAEGLKPLACNVPYGMRAAWSSITITDDTSKAIRRAEAIQECRETVQSTLSTTGFVAGGAVGGLYKKNIFHTIPPLIAAAKFGWGLIRGTHWLAGGEVTPQEITDTKTAAIAQGLKKAIQMSPESINQAASAMSKALEDALSDDEDFVGTAAKVSRSMSSEILPSAAAGDPLVLKVT